MRKFLRLFVSVLIILIFVNNIYADTPMEQSEKFRNVVYTDEERETVCGVEKYNIYLNDESIGETIDVFEHIPFETDDVSLREFIEKLGGTIVWDPSDEIINYRRYLGYFELFGNKYFYKSDGVSATGGESFYYYIILTTYINNNETIIPMSLSTDQMFTKLIDNKIYTSIENLRNMLPRMGYLFSIDKESHIINIKKYDFDKEKDLMNDKFPEEKFGKSIYNTEYPGNTYYKLEKEYVCKDAFLEQFKDTSSYENRYFDYIDNEYKPVYLVNNDINNFFSNMLQAACLTHIDGDITVEYDEDLEAYIIYNKDYKNVDELDDSYKIIVIRKCDNMFLYKKQ